MQAQNNESKILVIDDPVSCKLVKLALSEKNYRVILATTGRQGIDLFEEHRPALVITGWTMPDLAAGELCQHIRSRSHGFYTYIVVLSGRTDKDSLIKALDAGADDYLTKPFHRGELLARVGVGLRLAELQRHAATKNVLLEELALTDPLTGLPNRRAVEDWASSQLSGAARHGFCFWVVLADLDYFKQVNDTFGHHAGDAVLKQFSKVLKSQLRSSDFCGRLGGEEFLIVMTHATRDNILKVLERIRTELQMSPVTFGGCTVAVTASFGIAGFEKNQIPPTLSRLQRLADAALYLAKRGGRNRVEIAAAVAH